MIGTSGKPSPSVSSEPNCGPTKKRLIANERIQANLVAAFLIERCTQYSASHANCKMSGHRTSGSRHACRPRQSPSRHQRPQPWRGAKRPTLGGEGAGDRWLTVCPGTASWREHDNKAAICKQEWSSENSGSDHIAADEFFKKLHDLRSVRSQQLASCLNLSPKPEFGLW